MVYKGRLKVAGDPGEGIPVDLSIDDVYVDLVSGGENLGRWRMDVVELSRLAGNEFAMGLDGEQMVFVAADPLGFAYNAVTTIEEISGRLRKKRGLFRKRADSPRKPKEDSVSTVEVVAQRPSADLEDLLPRQPGLGRLLPPPVGLASHRDALSEPGSADDRIESNAPIEPVEAVEILEPQGSIVLGREVTLEVVDEVIEVEMPELRSEETLDAVEVPVADTTVERGLDDPEVEEVEPLGEDDSDGTRSVGDDVATLESTVPVADHPPVGAEEVQVESDEGEFELVDVEPIENTSDHPVGDTLDVGSAGDGAAATIDAVPDGEVLEESVPADHVEVEQPEEVFDPAGTPVDDHRAEPDDGESAVVEHESVSESHVSDQPDRPEEPPLTQEDATDDSGTAPAQAAVPAAAPQPQTRRRRFGRSRAEDAHVHDYAESKTVGGITRRVCGHCGHVSFAGEDVYQEWK